VSGRRTQVERILLALSAAGPRGLTRVDFQAPNVIDGGPPILNFPGRIGNLRDAGHRVEDRWDAASGCKRYVLASSAPAPRTSTPAALPPTAPVVGPEQLDLGATAAPLAAAAVAVATDGQAGRTLAGSHYDPWSENW